MTETQTKILAEISRYLSENPAQRLAQVLFNLNITQSKPDSAEIRDIYYDTDAAILERILERIEQFKEPK